MGQHQRTSSTHLPILYNHLLNCIFNNPHYNKSPFKNVVEELRTKHNQYTIIVPSAFVLNEFYDPATEGSSNRVLLKELCYNNEEFIKSHIIQTGSPVSSTITPISKEQLVIYKTMDNKQVLLKNRMIYTGKGFRRSLKLKILAVSYFRSFCDYFPKGSQFMLVHIESTLFGGQPYIKSSLPLAPILNVNDSSTASKSNSLTLESINNKIKNESVTFEKLLRNFPLLARAVGDKFNRLFHHNNHQFYGLRSNTRKKLEHIKIEFHKILDEAFKIILDSVKEERPNGEATYNLINHIISIHPNLNLDKLVHEYVELNLYDVLWSQLIYQYNYPNDDKANYDPSATKVMTSAKYEQLSCLSLNQLDVPLNKPWQLNELHHRIYQAVQELKKLSTSSTTTSTLAAKMQIIYNTINILTNPSQHASMTPDLVIDADTLMALLIMTIVHAKVDNLEAHLFYIESFSASDVVCDGHFSYIMSTLDAVICHLSDNDKGLNTLIQSSQQNLELWSAIFELDLVSITKIVESFKNATLLPEQHCLKSRNISGEGALTFALKANNYDVYKLLLDGNPNWFTIDDILYEKNVVTNQNLLMCALLEETKEQIVLDLLETIIENATVKEQQAYYNMQDLSGRSIGHYLFHNMSLISKIGHLIDWELRDRNTHTPLFSLCRCYDHPEYIKLVQAGFEAVYLQLDKMRNNHNPNICSNGTKIETDACKDERDGIHINYDNSSRGIDFEKHIDKNGNTLLHVILKGIPETRILSRELNLVDVNISNYRHLTPLMLYVKYGRLENLESILADNRLDFLAEDPSTHYNIFDYLSFLAGRYAKENVEKIEKKLIEFYFSHYFPLEARYKLVALNGKYDPSTRDWYIYYRAEDQKALRPKSLNSLKHILYLEKLQRPFTTFIDSDIFWRNYATNISTTPMFHKLRVNSLIHRLNILFQSVACQNIGDSRANDLFNRFLTNDEDELVLELKKTITDLLELKKLKLGEVKLKVGQVQEIEYFLDYCLEEMRRAIQIFSKLSKVAIIGEQKQIDVQNVENSLLYRFDVERFFQPFKTLTENETLVWVSGSLGNFGDYLVWIELAGKELLKNIFKISADIQTWKDLYHAIYTINRDLRSMEYPTGSLPTASSNAKETDPKALLREGGNTLSRTPTNSSDYTACNSDVPNTVVDDSEGIFNLLASSKRSKYKKLVVARADLVKQIMKLNVEIKWLHEIIATELSQFIKFRGRFLEFSTKLFVNEEMRSLRKRKLELEKFLYKVKNS